MKAFLASLLLLLSLSIPAKAQSPVAPAEDFQKTLSAATLSVYQGKQVCEFTAVDTIFGPMKVWGCSFKRQFTCTATVIARTNEDTYIGLSAGHCIDWNEEKNYFVGSSIASDSVLHNINILKAENDDRYDFALFEFHSMRELPVVPVSLKGGVPALGTKVININFALGIGKHFSTGVVTSEPLNDEAVGMKQRFMTNLESAPGASGSAVVDADTYKIIGLCEFGYRAGNLGMGVVPTGDRLANFMDDDSAGIKPLPEPVKPAVDATQSFFKAIVNFFTKLLTYSTGI
jgi:Trypsin-like peptidase domain